jgi:hypothetical protein
MAAFLVNRTHHSAALSSTFLEIFFLLFLSIKETESADTALVDSNTKTKWTTP